MSKMLNLFTEQQEDEEISYQTGDIIVSRKPIDPRGQQNDETSHKELIIVTKQLSRLSDSAFRQ